jgi:hypothetical protein
VPFDFALLSLMNRDKLRGGKRNVVEIEESLVRRRL